jgi:hypothetical protein
MLRDATPEILPSLAHSSATFDELAPRMRCLGAE